MGQRLRKARRFRYMLDVMLHLSGGVVRAGSLDVSQNGMFVYVKDCGIGCERLRLTLSIPTRNTPLNLLGRIAWKTPLPNSRHKGKVGVGIELSFQADEDRLAWEDFVEAVRQGRISDTGLPAAPIKRLKHLHQPSINLRDEVGTLGHLSLQTIWDASASQSNLTREPTESA